MSKIINEYYVDLHIHIGRTETNKPVKISAAKDLTIKNIIEVAAHEKGMNIIGVIDCHVPEVQQEIKQLIDKGIVTELAGGGLSFEETTVIMGCEVEVKEEGYQPVHYLCYFPTLELMEAFTAWLKPHMKNINLSSQRLYRTTQQLQKITRELDGLFIPAHIFTPYKGIYGSVSERMEEICNLAEIDGVELGLSGNTDMAKEIKELYPFTFVTNSDAHSLGKIAREYQIVGMYENTFTELKKALKSTEKRGIIANYGLSPLLGKYHLSYCNRCKTPFEENAQYCHVCGGSLLKGVVHRIEELAQLPISQSALNTLQTSSIHRNPQKRPPYFEQIPLDFYPGVGKKTYEKLLDTYKTEMNILHRVPIEDLEVKFGQQLAQLIRLSRSGELHHEAGGGGKYGKVFVNK